MVAVLIERHRGLETPSGCVHVPKRSIYYRFTPVCARRDGWVLAQLCTPSEKLTQAAQGIKDFQGFGSTNSIVSQGPHFPEAPRKDQLLGLGMWMWRRWWGRSKKVRFCKGTVGLDYARSVLRFKFIP